MAALETAAETLSTFPIHPLGGHDSGHRLEAMVSHRRAGNATPGYIHVALHNLRTSGLAPFLAFSLSLVILLLKGSELDSLERSSPRQIWGISDSFGNNLIAN